MSEREHCPIHGEHGGEAEELRSGIEKLVRNAERAIDVAAHDDADELVVKIDDLNDLLDNIDARDSCAWLERMRCKGVADGAGACVGCGEIPCRDMEKSP